VEEYLKQGNYADLNSVPWDDIRMEEMAAKTKRWGAQQANGLLEMTPSKLNVILDNQKEFNEGLLEAVLQQPDGLKRAKELGLIQISDASRQ
jgi:hypothetical protein